MLALPDAGMLYLVCWHNMLNRHQQRMTRSLAFCPPLGVAFPPAYRYDYFDRSACGLVSGLTLRILLLVFGKAILFDPGVLECAYFVARWYCHYHP